MNDLTIFIVGCGVSFLCLGGMLIHMVAGQKIAEAEDLGDESDRRRKELSRSREEKPGKGS